MDRVHLQRLLLHRGQSTDGPEQGRLWLHTCRVRRQPEVADAAAAADVWDET